MPQHLRHPLHGVPLILIQIYSFIASTSAFTVIPHSKSPKVQSRLQHVLAHSPPSEDKPCTGSSLCKQTTSSSMSPYHVLSRCLPLMFCSTKKLNGGIQCFQTIDSDCSFFASYTGQTAFVSHIISTRRFFPVFFKRFQRAITLTPVILFFFLRVHLFHLIHFWSSANNRTCIVLSTSIFHT